MKATTLAPRRARVTIVGSRAINSANEPAVYVIRMLYFWILIKSIRGTRSSPDDLPGARPAESLVHSDKAIRSDSRAKRLQPPAASPAAGEIRRRSASSLPRTTHATPTTHPGGAKSLREPLLIELFGAIERPRVGAHRRARLKRATSPAHGTSLRSADYGARSARMTHTSSRRVMRVIRITARGGVEDTCPREPAGSDQRSLDVR